MEDDHCLEGGVIAGGCALWSRGAELLKAALCICVVVLYLKTLVHKGKQQ